MFNLPLKSKIIIVTLLLLPIKSFASPLYWSLFNVEEESTLGAQYVTYATQEDMLNDENRLDVFDPDGTFLSTQRNIVGSGSDGSTFWSLFNIEGESTLGAQYVTYSTIEDMLNDTNRLDVFDPDGTFLSTQSNIVGSGTDGSIYWSLFNIEGETTLGAQYVTYATLDDMLNDTNRLGVFDPDGTFISTQRNIVGSGSDGSSYWSLFNIEGETTLGAQYVTYATLDDMLNDTNRIDVFDPDGTFLSTQRNIVGSGAFMLADVVGISEPNIIITFCIGFLGLLLTSKKRSAATPNF